MHKEELKEALEHIEKAVEILNAVMKDEANRADFILQHGAGAEEDAEAIAIRADMIDDALGLLSDAREIVEDI